jgi:DNA mismatch endonuclease, patch repair protein
MAVKMARDPATTSRIMSAIRGRDTGPEMRLRRELHGRGMRYRLRHPTLAGRPDIIFPRARVAVFVDGDYWHGNTWRLRGAASLEDYLGRLSNAEFWLKKITATVARDKEVTSQLASEGWCVIRLWESDIDRDLSAAGDLVEQAVRGTSVKRAIGSPATSPPVAFHG